MRKPAAVLILLPALAGLLWLGSGCQSLRPRAPLYGARIELPADAGADLQETAADLARTLERMTGRAFSVGTSTNDGPAIYLARASDGHLPAGGVGDLPGRGPEAYLLRSEPDRLWIVGNTERAIAHGVYGYLDQLGCRWYLPNDRWTIVPRRASIAVRVDTVEAPAFRLRNFFGTGGYGGRLPVDTNGALQARWELWKKRNRLGGSVQFGGHSYESYNHAVRKELEAHPEYLAELNGRRQPWDPGTKPCYGNPDARRLYVANRLAVFGPVVAQSPDSPRSFAVSVEPSDGGGHCTCADCLKLGSVSDRVFTWANAVARAVATNYPGRWVSLLAYNEHAAVPHIEIETNVFVLVVPYGFQRTGLPGDELLKAWGDKHRPLGLYDYWSIPDWASCLPSLSPLTTVPQKVRYWHEQGVEAFLGESTTSAGAAGLVWWIAARLFWNPAADERPLFDEFCAQSFGAAAPPMRRMLERWADGFLLSAHELGLSYRDLAEARALARDEAASARLDDYAVYVEWLKRWHEYQQAKRGTDAHRAAASALLRLGWRTYDSAMIQSFRMHQLIVNRYEKGDQALDAAWPLKQPQAEAWTTLAPPARPELDRWVHEGRHSYQPLEFEARTYSTNLVPLAAAPATPTGEVAWVESPDLVGQHRFAFQAGAGTTSVVIQVRVANRQVGSPGDRVTVIDPSGVRLLEELVPANGAWRALRIPTAAPGLYRLTVFDQKVMFTVKAPADLPFVLTGGFACPNLSTRLYFYVPAGLRRLAFHSPSVVPVDLRDGDGNPVAHDGGTVCAVDVPPGQDGRIWSVARMKSWQPWRLLNSPNAFALTPAGMLVPAEVAER